MALLSICKQNKGFTRTPKCNFGVTPKEGGFTLIEIIVAVAIFIIILSFGIVVDINSISRNDLQTKKSNLVSLLERARSMAMANIDQSSYGVCPMGSEYEIIKGPSCEVTFVQLSGDMQDMKNHTIYITDGAKSADITINSLGAINW